MQPAECGHSEASEKIRCLFLFFGNMVSFRRKAAMVPLIVMSTDMDNSTVKENGPKMDVWSKGLLVIFSIAILLSIAASYDRYMVKRDYIIEAQVDCDPMMESCFVQKCDPESQDVTTMCTGNPKEDTTYYKNIRKNAMNISLCNPQNADCKPMVCAEGETDCSYTLCEDGNADNVPCSTAEDAASSSSQSSTDVIPDAPQDAGTAMPVSE